jgi:hypothetical protein
MKWRILFIRNSPPEWLPRKLVSACSMVLSPPQPPQGVSWSSEDMFIQKEYLWTQRKRVVELEFKKCGWNSFSVTVLTVIIAS